MKVSYCNIPNFGDQLGPYIIKKLSGQNIKYVEEYLGCKTFLKILIKSILKLNFKRLKTLHFPFEKVIIGVGSIIGYSGKGSLIWGSGFMNQDENFHGGKLYLVRGPYTREKLINLGYNCPNSFGDPALVLPLIYHSKTRKKYLLGIIPHWTEINSFTNQYSNNHKIIDLNTNCIEKVIDEILSCEYILSTSLHGLIVAHAYGIPAIWIKKGYIHTDGFKFKDYFSSVGIKPYNGFTDFDDIINNNNTLIHFFYSNKDLSQPQINLKGIQYNIIYNAPFRVLDSYKKQIRL